MMKRKPNDIENFFLIVSRSCLFLWYLIVLLED